MQNLTPAEDEAGAVLVRVISYNIHKGFSAASKRFVLSTIRDNLVQLQPDILFLQEVQGEHRRRAKKILDWPDSPHAEFLAGTYWPHHIYAKNRVHIYGDHGNAILSRYPIVASENIDVSTNRLERRGLLHATIRHPQVSTDIDCFCVHLNLLNRSRSRQIARLKSEILSRVPAGHPFIAAGDFNDWNIRCKPELISADSREVFCSSLGSHARTFPSWKPVLQLDRIYYSGAEVRHCKVLTGLPWSRLSDHAPVLAELDLPPMTAPKQKHSS